jgi:FAD/FMN-containing dehydrogenase
MTHSAADHVPAIHSFDRVLEALVSAIGHDCVLTGPALEGRHMSDWSDAPAASPRALLLPRTPSQVAAALQICHRDGQPVTVQGGLTGLAGGANPQPGEIALSLARLDAIEDVDPVGGTIVVQAGVTLERLQTVVAESGWMFPLDLGARGSCHVGGNAATNAGGNRVLRHGMMRQSILGLEVALADGTLLTMLDRVIKNNAGFDLKHLFIGTEGSLGIITRLSLKLEPARDASCTVLCGVANFAKSSLLLRQAKSMLPELSAFELMWHGYFEAAAAAIKRPLPFERPFPLYVLIETHGADGETGQAAVERFLARALEEGIVDDAIVAQSVDQAAQLWSYRESVSELLSLLRPCAAFDVSVSMPKMEALVDELRESLSRQHLGKSHLFFGHLGDGNLHLISGPYPDRHELEDVEDLVYRCVGRHRGSVSAEHGIGVVKKAHLHHSRSIEEISLMTRLKQLLDPQHILNPGRVVDARTSI